ncbi:MAG: benzoate transporter [Oceanospirillales bacterium]|nr:benzoate transporter [Oceanospirillales bacterium]
MFRRWQFNEVSAAYADLGTFLPLVIGLIVVAGMDPVGLLFGFGIFAIATGVIYRRPIPVQPMKAIAAAGIAGIAGPEVLIATGILLGLTLLILSQTQVIGYLKSLIPKTVLHGMRLALAASLIITAFGFDDVDVLPLMILLALLVATQLSALRSISCLLVILTGFLWLGSPLELQDFAFGVSFPEFTLPRLESLSSGLQSLFLPQLALTLTNALILTAIIAQNYFPDSASELTERRFSMTSGLANLLLAPFGAMPMCHGAGGLAAHYGMGSRTGLSLMIFGLTCLVIALFFGDQSAQILHAIPAEVTATLVLFAAWVLADPLKLLKVRSSCQLIIVLMVPLTLWGGLFLALVAGILLELARAKYDRSVVSSTPS